MENYHCSWANHLYMGQMDHVSYLIILNYQRVFQRFCHSFRYGSTLLDAQTHRFFAVANGKPSQFCVHPTWLGDGRIIDFTSKTLDDICYPLVMTNSVLLKMAIEVVDFPINSMVIFHSYVNVYQRATTKRTSGNNSCEVLRRFLNPGWWIKILQQWQFPFQQKPCPVQQAMHQLSIRE